MSLPTKVIVDVTAVYQFAEQITSQMPNMDLISAAHLKHTVVTDTLDKVILGTHSFNSNAPLELLQFYYSLGKPITEFSNAQEKLLIMISHIWGNFDLLMLQHRETHVVSCTYKLIEGYRAIINFHLTMPTRDYQGILAAEVDKAIEAGEFVPYSYLRILGRL